jgi:hypothetical protein
VFETNQIRVSANHAMSSRKHGHAFHFVALLGWLLEPSLLGLHLPCGKFPTSPGKNQGKTNGSYGSFVVLLP